MFTRISEVLRCLVVAACAAGAVNCFNQHKAEAAAEKAEAEKTAAVKKAEAEKDKAVKTARMKSWEAVDEARRAAEARHMKDNAELIKEFYKTNIIDIPGICEKIEHKRVQDTMGLFHKLSAEDLMDNIRGEIRTRGESKHTYWVHTAVGEIVILVEFGLDGETIVVLSRKLIEGK